MDFKHQEIWRGKREGLGLSNNKKYNGAILFSYITCIRICEQQKRLQILVFSWCYKLSHSKHLFLEATYMLRRVYKVE